MARRLKLSLRVGQPDDEDDHDYDDGGDDDHDTLGGLTPRWYDTAFEGVTPV